jgi:hypothetical protein
MRAVFRSRMGERGRDPYFSREFCTARELPKHTNKTRISHCLSSENTPILGSHYRAQNSPSQPNRIKYFPLYFGERRGLACPPGDPALSPSSRLVWETALTRIDVPGPGSLETRKSSDPRIAIDFDLADDIDLFGEACDRYRPSRARSRDMRAARRNLPPHALRHGSARGLPAA